VGGERAGEAVMQRWAVSQLVIAVVRQRGGAAM
jgi:hypothetical protein